MSFNDCLSENLDKLGGSESLTLTKYNAVFTTYFVMIGLAFLMKSMLDES